MYRTTTEPPNPALPLSVTSTVPNTDADVPKVDADDPADEVEVDVDLGDDEQAQLARDTLPEGVEFLGVYPTIEEYMRDMLSPEISRECQWVLDHLDWREVQARFEGKDGRLLLECGQVFRVALKASPTRGC